MSTLHCRKTSRFHRGQTLIELTLILPFLISLGLAVIEFGNILYSYLVLTHVTREASNLTSRQTGAKGSSAWAANVNSDLNRIMNSSTPVIRGDNLPDWLLTYSMIVWDPGASCGLLEDGSTTDRFVIERNGTGAGWVNPTWIRGSLSVTNDSNIGADGTCASIAMPAVKSLPPGETLHVVEAFYNYGPNRLTPVHNFIGPLIPGTFYTRSVFTDLPGA